MLLLLLNMNNKYINKVFYNLSSFVCFILIVPIIIYIICISTIEEYENNTFMIISIILVIVLALIIIFIIMFNIIISKRRHKIYDIVIKKHENYIDGINKLNHLLSIPQSRLNVSSTLLYLAYTKMFQLEFDETLKRFEEVKVFDKKFNVGIKNSILASYYKILIYFHLEDNASMHIEIQYFDSLRDKLNRKVFNEVIICIDAIKRNDTSLVLEHLKAHRNTFINVIITKIDK